MRYDGRGRRVIETTDGTDTRLLWCGEAICQTRTAGDVPTKYHYPQGELRGSQRLYYARDHLGSVREVRDLASGQTPAAFDYTPYGAIRAQNASLTPDRGFAGMWRHPSGLYLTHYRAYSPSYGRWLTRDPIHEAGGTNLYAYVGNSPINYTDPMGLWRLPGDIYDDATKDAHSRFPRNTWHNGPGDAYRHCLASCMLTQENSEAEANFFGWANEKRGDWTHNQEEGERQMDDANNAAGRACGTTANSKQDCVKSCLNAPLTQSYQSGSTPGYLYSGYLY